jgi:competence protein ComEA
VDLWRRRAPALFERLEAEPPRLAPVRARPPGAASPAPPRGRPPGARAFPPAAPSAERPLDLNRATAHELTRLPGIGPRLAARIVARREALGGRFAAAEDLAAVRGIGRRRAAELRPLVRVGAAAETSGPAAAEPP